jgi:hypothetical protein
MLQGLPGRRVGIDDGPLRIDFQDRVGIQLRKGGQAVDLRLGLLARGDVFDDRQAVKRLAGTVVAQGGIDVYPDDGAVLAQVTFLIVVGGGLAPEQLLENFPIMGAVFRVGDLRKAHLQQLVGSVAGDGA